jgi:alkylated DNA repair dioxygenase AlkB
MTSLPATIPGLRYLPNYISLPHHAHLIKTIDEQPWRGDLNRRTQHYGYVYDYKAKSVDPSMRLGDLPPWLNRIAAHLCADGLIPELPDQAIVNEYQPGQGIADHIDCTPCFGGIVLSLSLAAPVVMDLKRSSQSVRLLLEPRSLLVLQGEARYHWTHGIAKRKQDSHAGKTITRERRVSVTFRKVVVES